MTTTVLPSESTDTATVIPRKREALHIHCIDGEAVLYDPRTCATFLLNPVALHVWSRCDGRTTVGRALEELTRRYDVDSTTALGHVYRVLTLFEDAGLLVGNEDHA